jgi:hypothetical protein
MAKAGTEADPPKTQNEETKTSKADFVQRDNITASHKSYSENPTDEYKPRRNHGGALPQ